MVDYKIDSVVTDNFSMKYIKFGTGSKTFVIVPGISFFDVTKYAVTVVRLYEAFTDDYTIYLFDRKDKIEEGYKISDMADDLYTALGELGLKKVYLYGASMGGMISQSLAIKHPEAVEKMVLASTLSRNYDVAYEVIKQWIDLSSQLRKSELNRNVIDHVYSEEYIGKFSRLLYSLDRSITDEECEKFNKQASATLGFDVYDKLNNIKCPVLVMGSEKDKVTTPDGCRDIAEKLNCRLYMYEGYAHAVYDEAPDFPKRIFDFFAE